MSGYEEQLLTRAEVLEEVDELVQAVAAILAGAQRAGVDPGAVTSLAGAARALDPGADTSYDAGSNEDRRPGGGYGSDAAMLEAVSDAEDDMRERLREVQQLRERVRAALDAAQEDLAAARAALAAARAMPVKAKCDGCHAARAAAISAAEAAIAAAQERIRTCEAAADLLDPLAARLQQALDRLRTVPQELGDAYELIYQFIRRGGKLPAYGRWIEGAARV
jgi:DNA repair exonuclease SbcCD ATPase subunit